MECDQRGKPIAGAGAGVAVAVAGGAGACSLQRPHNHATKLGCLAQAYCAQTVWPRVAAWQSRCPLVWARASASDHADAALVPCAGGGAQRAKSTALGGTATSTCRDIDVQESTLCHLEVQAHLRHKRVHKPCQSGWGGAHNAAVRAVGAYRRVWCTAHVQGGRALAQCKRPRFKPLITTARHGTPRPRHGHTTSPGSLPSGCRMLACPGRANLAPPAARRPPPPLPSGCLLRASELGEACEHGRTLVPVVVCSKKHSSSCASTWMAKPSVRATSPAANRRTAT